jgi:hypothetical protein
VVVVEVEVEVEVVVVVVVVVLVVVVLTASPPPVRFSNFCRGHEENRNVTTVETDASAAAKVRPATRARQNYIAAIDTLPLFI